MPGLGRTRRCRSCGSSRRLSGERVSAGAGQTAWHERTDVVAEQCWVVAGDLDVRFELAQRVAIIVALLDHLRRSRTVIAHVELLADFIPAQQDLSHTPCERDPTE